MMLKTIQVPTFSGEPVAFRDGAAIHTEEFAIEISPHDHNRVKLSFGGIVRVVDGISLATAVDEVLAAYRRGPR